MNLLKRATQGNYQYYHLLSGTCFPLKSQDYLHQFFDDNNGKIFVECNDFLLNESNWKFKLRYSQYHWFQDYIGSKNNNLKRLDWGLCLLQKFFGINRTRKLFNVIKGGSTWFSIPNDFAHYLVQNMADIKKFVKNTYCTDEIFVPTWLYNSDFYAHIYKAANVSKYNTNLRYYDFKNGHPRFLNFNDFKKLYTSKFLFARKFNVAENPEDLKKAYALLKK